MSSLRWPVTSSLDGIWSRGDGCELIAEFFGPCLQTRETIGLVSPFVCRCTFIHVRLPPPEQAVDYRGQFPGSGKYRHISSDPSCHLAVVRPQGRLAVTQRCGRHPQRRPHPSARAVALLLLHRLAGARRVVRCQRYMLYELLLGGQRAHVRSVFTEHHLHCFHPDGVDPRQIHSAHPVQSLAHRLFPMPLDRLPFLWILHLRHCLSPALLPLHLRQLAQNLLLVVGDPLLDAVVHLQSLTQAEQVILPPVPAQLLGNLLLALAAAWI